MSILFHPQPAKRHPQTDATLPRDASGCVASQFASESELKDFLSSTSIKLVYSNEKALALSGEMWKRYSKRRKKELQCPECGKFVTIHCENCNSIIASRQRMVSDFMIGAHALIHAETLLSRDRGFYKTYFKDVAVRNKI